MSDPAAQSNALHDDFRRYQQAYFDGCKQRFAPLDTAVAKLECEDLIAGFSDCDFRLILDSSIGAHDLSALDEAISAVHAGLCRDHPHWIHMLEHPPGFVLIWNELQDPGLYYPESRMWRACLGDIKRFGQYLDELPPDLWRAEDERFCLSKFADYYGGHQPKLGPPINLRDREAEYAWHSRAMHYFAPAIQAAVCVIDHRMVRGKLRALRRGAEILDRDEIFTEILERIEHRYDMPDRSDGRALRRFEDRMVSALREIKPRVFEAATVVDIEADDPIETLRQRLSECPEEPLKVLFNGIRYARCRKGRLAFYLQAPPYYEVEHQIECDLAKLKNHTLTRGLRAYGQLRCGKADADLDDVTEVICPSLISRDDADLLRTAWALVRADYPPGGAADVARRTVTIWGDVCLILETIFDDARKLQR